MTATGRGLWMLACSCACTSFSCDASPAWPKVGAALWGGASERLQGCTAGPTRPQLCPGAQKAAVRKHEGGSSRKWHRCQGGAFDRAAGAESQYGVATSQSRAPRWRLWLGRLVHEGKRACSWRRRTEILRRQLLGGA
eukprot:scaffold117243_cov35-Phaeocystis_antarctica.AAC.1